MKDSASPKLASVKGRTIAELTADLYWLGVQVRKQIGKKLIAKGGPWAAVGFCFQAFENGEFGEPKVMLASFRSDGSFYKRYSYFIVRNREEARSIVSFLKENFHL